MSCNKKIHDRYTTVVLPSSVRDRCLTLPLKTLCLNYVGTYLNSSLTHWLMFSVPIPADPGSIPSGLN